MRICNIVPCVGVGVVGDGNGEEYACGCIDSCDGEELHSGRSTRETVVSIMHEAINCVV